MEWATLSSGSTAATRGTRLPRCAHAAPSAPSGGREQAGLQQVDAADQRTFNRFVQVRRENNCHATFVQGGCGRPRGGGCIDGDPEGIEVRMRGCPSLRCAMAGTRVQEMRDVA